MDIFRCLSSICSRCSIDRNGTWCLQMCNLVFLQKVVEDVDGEKENFNSGAMNTLLINPISYFSSLVGHVFFTM